MGNKEIDALDAATLQRVREAAGMSRRELSQRIGKHFAWCSTIETGKMSLRKEEALRVCEALGLPTDTFAVVSAPPRRFNVKEFVRLLKKRRITQRTMARLIGCNAVNVGRWIREGAQPTERNVELIAETLEVSKASLYVEDGPENAPIVEDSQPSVLIESDEVLIRMPASVWERVKKSVETVAGKRLPHCDASSLASLASLLEG